MPNGIFHFRNVNRLKIILACSKFLFATFFLISCENDIEKVKIITKSVQFPTEKGKNIEVFYSDSAKILIKMQAPLMNHYTGDNPYIEMPKGIKVLFYNENMGIKSTLDAEYAVNYEKKRWMEARRNVVVVNEKGERLNTEHLIWDEYSERIFSEDFVKITTKDEIIFGQGFEANQNFTKYKIFKIKGNIKINQ